MSLPWRVVGLMRARLDLSDFAALKSAFDQDRPSLVLHCAAISKPTECDAGPARAWRVNSELTGQLAQLAASIPFVFFSTDHIFDGRAGNYSEDAPRSPLSLYARTKVAAEDLVTAPPRHLIIRTSLNGGTSPTGDRGFNEPLRRAWSAGQVTRLFTDEFRSPIAASVTARAVWERVLRRATGTFHIAGAERLSRWQIGQLLAARWPQLAPRIEAAYIADHRGGPRPPDTSLDCRKAQALLSFPLPGLTAWLREHPDDEF